MRIVDGFKLRSVAGEMVVSGEGVNQINFNKLITLNSSAAFLWGKVEGIEFTKEQLATFLVEEYEIDMELAIKDATALADKWLEVGIIEK